MVSWTEDETTFCERLLERVDEVRPPKRAGFCFDSLPRAVTMHVLSRLCIVSTTHELRQNWKAYAEFPTFFGT
jgi:hypothetical protein